MTAELEQVAEHHWAKDGVDYFLHRHGLIIGYWWWCGYARFPKRPLVEEGYGGIAVYVPVHGSITFAQEENGTMTYGFNCGYLDDTKNPHLQDIDWLRAETERMATSIRVAAEYEQRYLSAHTTKEKASVLVEYHERLQEQGILFAMGDNFGAMIRAISERV